MGKRRLEAFSDNMFSIVMTLFIFNIISGTLNLAERIFGFTLE
jgi:uncharacterized membrane protein